MKKIILFLLTITVAIMALFFGCKNGEDEASELTIQEIISSAELIPEDGTWINGSLSDNGNEIWDNFNEIDVYYFDADGSDYRISWDDSYDGSGNYTCDIWVYVESTMYSYISEDSGYNGYVITPQNGERIYIIIETYAIGGNGTYAVKLEKI